MPHCVDTEHHDCLREEAVKRRQRTAKLRQEQGRPASVRALDPPVATV